MSWGFTAMIRMRPCLTASSTLTEFTPYRCFRYAERSAERSVTTMSSMVRPARSRPESRASPSLPAPRIASVSTRDSLLLGGEGAEEERHVRRTLGEPAHQVAVPLGAVGDVDADRVPVPHQPELLLGADAVEELELERVLRAVVPLGPLGPDRDQPGVVGGEHRVAVAGHEHVQAPDIGPVHVERGLERRRLRLLVRALAEPDPRPGIRQVLAVG